MSKEAEEFMWEYKGKLTIPKLMEAYHKAQLEKMMPSDEELENIHQFNGAKWLKQKLLNK